MALTYEQVEKYLISQGHPYDGVLCDIFLNAGDKQHLYNECVANNYDLADFDRWLHLIDVFGCEIKYETAMKIDKALYEEDLEIMELGNTDTGAKRDSDEVGSVNTDKCADVYSGDLEHVMAEICARYHADDVELVEFLTAKAPDLSIEDAFALFARLRYEIDGDRVIYFKSSGEVFDIGGNDVLNEARLRALVSEYLDLTGNDFVNDYIENEVRRSVDLISGLNPDEEITRELISTVQENPGILFDHMGLNNFLSAHYEKYVAMRAAGNFVFDDELIVADDFKTVNGYLCAIDKLVDRLNPDEAMENIKFYADYNVENGEVVVAATYDTPTEDGETNKVVDLELTETEIAMVRIAMEKYCEKELGLSCVEFVNRERKMNGLEAFEYERKPLADQICDCAGKCKGSTECFNERSYIEMGK